VPRKAGDRGHPNSSPTTVQALLPLLPLEPGVEGPERPVLEVNPPVLSVPLEWGTDQAKAVSATVRTESVPESTKNRRMRTSG